MGINDKIVTLYKYCKPIGEDNTSYRNPSHVKLSTIVERIKTGKGVVDKLQKLEAEPDSDKKRLIKETLPSICFSGNVPAGDRTNERITDLTGLAILDFDHLADQWQAKWDNLVKTPYIVLCFRSPSQDGIKALVRLKDATKHLEHYAALMKDWPDADVKNKNIARVCFQSYDPNIYVNYDAKEYTKIIVQENVYIPSSQKSKDIEFNNLELWLQSKSSVYESGNRNQYIYMLAAACCRFGKDKEDTKEFVYFNYLSKDSSFTQDEANKAIESAYRSNDFGSAKMDGNTLKDKVTSKEVVIDLGDSNIVDVILGETVYKDALDIYNNGYISADPTGISQLDKMFKWKRGELTVLTGIGNHGKSLMLSFLMINKSIKDGTKWAVFSPENYPAHEFYHGLTEMVVGADCTPNNQNKPPARVYNKAYDFVKQHFFYIYPKELSPTPEYIKSIFLELIIKEKVGGCVIDPFNQLANDYAGKGGRDDKYLDTFLSDCSRFAIGNNVLFVIVCHPHKLKKNEDKSYDAPDVFDLAGGAMWNNKCDNILVYHRPYRHKDANDRTCEFHAKKIKRQNIVGKPGMETFEFDSIRRRFLFDEYPLKHFDLGVSSISEHRIIKNYSEPAKEDRLPTSGTFDAGQVDESDDWQRLYGNKP